MEKKMKDFQTPQRDPAAANRRSRKPLKIAKSLTAAFSSLSGDIIQPVPKHDGFSPISDLSNLNQIPDLDSSFVEVLNPDLSPSSESLLFTDLSASSTVTFDYKLLDKVPVDFSGSNDLDEVSESIEAEIAVNFLRRALVQVLQSTDVHHQSKKLINASMKIIVEDFLAVPRERDRIAELISAKSLVLSLGLLLWFIVLALTFFFGSGVKNSFTGPLPT